MHLVGETLFNPALSTHDNAARWADKNAGHASALRAEASFCLGRFGPFAAMPKGLGIRPPMRPAEAPSCTNPRYKNQTPPKPKMPAESRRHFKIYQFM